MVCTTLACGLADLSACKDQQLSCGSCQQHKGLTLAMLSAPAPCNELFQNAVHASAHAACTLSLPALSVHNVLSHGSDRCPLACRVQ